MVTFQHDTSNVSIGTHLKINLVKLMCFILLNSWKCHVFRITFITKCIPKNSVQLYNLTLHLSDIHQTHETMDQR